MRVEELDKQLNIALSENDTLLKAHKDLEKWKQKLEKESKSTHSTHKTLDNLDSMRMLDYWC